MLSREEELKKIERFKAFAEPMFYRTNDLNHTRRVAWIVQHLNKFLRGYDKKLAVRLAKVHDDAEIVNGDIISHVKLDFTQEEKKRYDEECKEAIKKLVENYKDDFEDYEKLLMIEEERSSPEFLVVKFADKVDAHCEVCHEILAGNRQFTKGFRCQEIFTDSYSYTFNTMMKYFEKLEEVIYINKKCPILNPIYNSEFSHKVQTGKIHTSESVKDNIGYEPYDTWKRLVLENGSKEDIKELYEQKEFN